MYICIFCIFFIKTPYGFKEMAPQNITQKRIVIDSGNRLRTNSSDMSRLAVSSEGIPVNILVKSLSYINFTIE